MSTDETYGVRMIYSFIGYHRKYHYYITVTTISGQFLYRCYNDTTSSINV